MLSVESLEAMTSDNVAKGYQFKVSALPDSRHAVALSDLSLLVYFELKQYIKSGTYYSE